MFVVYNLKFFAGQLVPDIGTGTASELVYYVY